jgi:hypothetical protein
MQSIWSESYVSWALELACASAAVANYCDHGEHNEPTDRAWVLDAGRTLRALACDVAGHEGEDLQERYAARLASIERRNPLWEPERYDGGAAAAGASTWRALQLVQADHDRWYHPDVVGLPKQDQLRHYALHVAKLTGALAEIAQGSGDVADFCARRLPDLLLFGVKLPTVVGHRLPDTPLSPGRPTGALVAV